MTHHDFAPNKLSSLFECQSVSQSDRRTDRQVGRVLSLSFALSAYVCPSAASLQCSISVKMAALVDNVSELCLDIILIKRYFTSLHSIYQQHTHLWLYNSQFGPFVAFKTNDVLNVVRNSVEKLAVSTHGYCSSWEKSSNCTNAPHMFL